MWYTNWVPVNEGSINMNKYHNQHDFPSYDWLITLLCIRLDTSMCSHVPCEMTISWKRFVTVIAMKWLNWCFTSSTILHVFLIRGLVSVNFVTRLTLKHVTICVASWAILLVEHENDFEHWSQSLLFLWYWWMWELNCFLVLKVFSGPPDQTEGYSLHTNFSSACVL